MKHVSDLGNQQNNGPHQDQIVDNFSALFGIVGQKSDLLCLTLRSSRSKYNVPQQSIPGLFSPWYNRNGCLGIKHQFAYLPGLFISTLQPTVMVNTERVQAPSTPTPRA